MVWIYICGNVGLVLNIYIYICGNVGLVLNIYIYICGNVGLVLNKYLLVVKIQLEVLQCQITSLLCFKHDRIVSVDQLRNNLNAMKGLDV
jgi:hypothetical protein